MNKDHREIEVRFLNIDKEKLIQDLINLKAEDLGEDFFREMIFEDQAGKWKKLKDRMVRIREKEGKTFLSYKQFDADTVDGTLEIQLQVDNADKTKDFLEAVGLQVVRIQEKKCHTFQLGETTVGIDTWPNAPTYVELEGNSEEDLKSLADQLGFKWDDAVFENAKKVLENYYHIPVSKLKYFTFDKIEEHLN